MDTATQQPDTNFAFIRVSWIKLFSFNFLFFTLERFTRSDLWDNKYNDNVYFSHGFNQRENYHKQSCQIDSRAT